MKNLLTHPLYRKFQVAFVAALSTLLVAMAPTATEAVFVVTGLEWYFVIIAAASALGVYRLANKQ